MDKELIKTAKAYREMYKGDAENYEKRAKENRNMQKICEILIKQERSKGTNGR